MYGKILVVHEDIGNLNFDAYILGHKYRRSIYIYSEVPFSGVLMIVGLQISIFKIRLSKGVVHWPVLNLMLELVHLKHF